MSKGVRFIGGKEFLLAGRFTERTAAMDARGYLLEAWQVVVVRKSQHRFGDWSVWVHGNNGRKI